MKTSNPQTKTTTVEAQDMAERFRVFWVYFFYIFIIGGGAVYHFILAPH